MYYICMNQANQTINISLPKTMMEDIKELIAAGHFATVSETLRAGVNKVKVELLPKYYKEVAVGPRALARLKRAKADIRAGKAIRVKSFVDLLS